MAMGRPKKAEHLKLIKGDYYATEKGFVFSKKNNKILKPYTDRRGYLRVSLSVNGIIYKYLLHRLIAEAFHGPSDLTVDHIDNNKKNNRPENLQYLSALDNHKKATKDGAIHSGTTHYSSTLSPKQIQEIRSSTLPQHIIGKKFNLCQSVISRIKNNRTYKND